MGVNGLGSVGVRNNYQIAESAVVTGSGKGNPSGCGGVYWGTGRSGQVYPFVGRGRASRFFTGGNRINEVTADIFKGTGWLSSFDSASAFARSTRKTPSGNHQSVCDNEFGIRIYVIGNQNFIQVNFVFIGYALESVSFHNRVFHPGKR